MKLLYSVPVSNQSATFYLPVGLYGTLQVEYDVVTSTGQTMTRADAGNILLNWNGEDIINVDAEILNLLDNVYGGVAEASFQTAAANRMTVIIPCGFWFDSTNAYYVNNKDRVYLKLDFSSLSAKCSSGNIRIYAKPKLGVMNYIHKIIKRSVIASGAGSVSDVIPINNVAAIYYKNPSGANVSEIQLNKDDETFVDSAVKNLNAYSDWIHLLESTNNTIAVDLCESKDIRESVGNQLSYKYSFTGAGTLEQYISFIVFTPFKAAESKQFASLKLTKQSA